MREYHYLFTYYKLFNKLPVVIARYLLIIIIGFIILVSLQNLFAVKLLLVVLSVIVMSELYIHLRVNKVSPPKTIHTATVQTIPECIYFNARYPYERAVSGEELVKKLYQYPENKFLLKKIRIEHTLPKFKIEKQDVLTKAYALVASVQGNYITRLDLFAAAILLSESQTKILEASEMDEQDYINTYYWVRNKYDVESQSKEWKLHYYGDGSFDFFIYGWNTELKKYARNITASVLSKKRPPTVIGRAHEYEELLVSISKNGPKNILFIGEPGTGKTSLVEFFAYHSHLGNVPSNVSHMQVYELYIDRLLAGVTDRGMLEERLITVIDEVLHAGNIVLLIQNIENIFGAGGFDFDISGFLYQYLKTGGIILLGTTTQVAYKTHIASKDALSNLFTSIELPEPNKNDALFMLFEKIGEIENEYRCEVTYPAVKALIDYSDSYLTDRCLPGKAITLLESIATAHHLNGKNIHITKETVEEFISAQTHILLGEPTTEEKALLLNMEEELKKRVVSQPLAVQVIASAMRRVRSGLKTERRPIAVFLFLGPTGVGKTETAKALASVYFGSDDHMIRLDMSEYQSQESLPKLLGESVGEQYSQNAFTEIVAQSPFSLILLDEFEKAHPQILNLFLQVFDDGRLTDNKGRTISFQNSIIIATSNAGSEFIRNHIKDSTENTLVTKQLLDEIMKAKIYTPELINRFDEVVVFNPLTKESLKSVAQLLLTEAFEPLKDKNITITFDDLLIEKVVADSYDEQFGARAIRRYITSTISEFVSKQILQDKIVKGNTVMLSVDSSGEITIR
jgi:ATP-dependent Clp protease ATP-binding subunit ClpC